MEADLKNFFGSLNHEWMIKFIEHRQKIGLIDLKKTVQLSVDNPII